MKVKIHKKGSPDRLTLIRAKYVASVRTKKAEIAELEKKINLLDEVESESLALSFSPRLNGHYSGVKLTQAAHEAVIEIGGQVTATQVRKHLVNGGYVPNTHFNISVAKTLNRLAEQDKLKTELNDGKRVYWKPESK